MNLFQKYGIREVANVAFFSINSIGDETIYTPVLYLDTLKVSTIEKTSQKVSAEGGKGNKKLVSWNFGKEISLAFEDALFTPASMSMMMNGKLQNKLSPYMSVIVKSNVANKYGMNHYSVKAYASPALTDDEWNIVYQAATEAQVIVDGKKGDENYWYVMNNEAESDQEKEAYIIENQTLLRKAYTYRTWGDREHKAMPIEVINKVLTYIDELNKIGNVQTDNYDVEVIDRMTREVVREKDSVIISTDEQKKNLFRYYMDDRSSSYTIYYDPKTMLPLLHIENGKIKGWTHEIVDEVDQGDTKFSLRPGTPYIKWTRTVKYITEDSNDSLGNVLVINADTFSGDYKITMETVIRNQKTHKDSKYQIVINRAQVNSDTNITLQADGEPTTFSMTVDVLAPKNGELMELINFNVDDDYVNGGDKVIPQNKQYTYTNTQLIKDTPAPEYINNNEIY